MKTSFYLLRNKLSSWIFWGHFRCNSGWGVSGVEHLAGGFILGGSLAALKGVFRNYLLADYSLILS